MCNKSLGSKLAGIMENDDFLAPVG